MKKTIIVSAAALMIIGLFVPIPKTYADGTKSYNAVAYKIVKWNRPFYKNLMFTQKEVYKFPHSLKSVDELWEGMAIDPAVSEVRGVVIDTAGSGASVEITEGDNFILPGEIIDISADGKLGKGDTVCVEYVPELQNADKKINTIVDVKKENKEESTVEKSTTQADKAEAVYIRSTRECEYPITGGKSKLGAADTETLVIIFEKYEFKADPYDNLPDYEITVGAHRYNYESSSGIVTDTVIKKVNEEKSIVLSKADRDAINKIIRSYSDKTSLSSDDTAQTTVKSTSPVPDDYVYDPSDSVHYIRLQWGGEEEYPSVLFIRSREEYDVFVSGSRSLSGTEEFKSLGAKYTDGYFKNHALVIVFTQESSGSNYYTGVQINPDNNEICINRYIPEVGTCDMAAWATVCEVSADDPILTKDSTKTQVIKTE